EPKQQECQTVTVRFVSGAIPLPQPIRFLDAHWSDAEKANLVFASKVLVAAVAGLVSAVVFWLLAVGLRLAGRWRTRVLAIALFGAAAIAFAPIEWFEGFREQVVGVPSEGPLTATYAQRLMAVVGVLLAGVAIAHVPARGPRRER